MRSRRLPAAIPPTSPNQSVEVRLLLALVEATQVDRWPGHFKTALMREEARLAGQLSAVERYLPTGTPAELRASLATENPLDMLLGWWEVKGREEIDFHEGVARLTEQEARAWWLFAEGFRERQIAEFMDGKQRRTRQFGISVRTVEDYISNGRRKLVRLFLQAA